MFKYDYNITPGDINLITLLEQIGSESTLSNPIGYSFNNDETVFSINFSEELDTNQQTSLNLIIENHNSDILVELKKTRYQEIDSRTNELIEEGFEFPPSSGLFFNLDPKSQIRIHGCDYARDLLPYPLKWQSLDDNNQISIVDADMMHNFFLVGLNTLKSRIDSGTALKEQIAQATTVEEVNAVIDNR